MALPALNLLAFDLVDALMGPWLMLPFAVLALAAIPYTITVRRKRRRERWREMGGPPAPEPYSPDAAPAPESAGEAEDRFLWMRLAVAFVICAGLAWLCYRVLPRAGVDVPWWVPVLCFGVIFVTMMVRRAGEKDEAAEDREHRAVAGRIGPDFMPRPDANSEEQ